MDQFNPKTLQQFRKLLYPAIAQGIITGYNVYNEPKDPTDTAIHYLHSDLGSDANGRNAEHLDTLIQTLQNRFPTLVTTNIASSVTDRHAVYQKGDWLDNPQGIKFYDAKGYRLRKRDVSSYLGPVIMEGNQYDISITPEHCKQFEPIIALLRRYTHQKLIDKHHLLTARDNLHSIIGSWDIPLITHNLYSRHMKKVDEVCINIDSYQSRTFLAYSIPLINFLKNSTEMIKSTAYVNKSFYYNYLLR